MERIVARKLARDLGEREILPANHGVGLVGGGGGGRGAVQTRTVHMGKCSCICI